MGYDVFKSNNNQVAERKKRYYQKLHLIRTQFIKKRAAFATIYASE